MPGVECQDASRSKNRPCEKQVRQPHRVECAWGLTQDAPRCLTAKTTRARSSTSHRLSLLKALHPIGRAMQFLVCVATRWLTWSRRPRISTVADHEKRRSVVVELHRAHPAHLWEACAGASTCGGWTAVCETPLRLGSGCGACRSRPLLSEGEATETLSTRGEVAPRQPQEQ